MAAVQVTTAASISILAANTSTQRRQAVIIQNLGPNAIAIDTTNAVTTATGLSIPTNGVVTLTSGINGALFARAATADQVSPADTRVLVELAD